MIRAGNGFWLLCALAVAGISCSYRPPRPHTVTPPQPTILLHGFFGDKEQFSDLLQGFLSPKQSSVLPSKWIGDLPLLSFSGPHQPEYIDRDAGGNDSDPLYGLESATLAVYAGHGHDITGWTIPDPFPKDWVSLDSVRVGDEELRYFWLYACKVLAHGPERVLGGLSYSAPQCFHSGDADVFERWTGAFACDMRMVCGGSTELGQTGVDAIWSYLLEAETSVADAWILGLANTEEVPVCLARGGPSQASSALRDRTLQTEKVAEGGWLHFQYPVKCNVIRQLSGSALQVSCNQPSVPAPGGEAAVCGASTKAPPPEQEEPTPGRLPKVKTLSLPAPGPTAESLALGFDRLTGHKDWKYQPDSGAVVFAKSREIPDRYDPLHSCDQGTDWTFQPEELLARTGLDPKVFASDPLKDFSFTALEMRVESRRDGARKGSCAVRSLFLLLQSTINVRTEDNPERYPIFGPAIVFELQRQDHGEPVLTSFSAPRRRRIVMSSQPPDELSSLKSALAAINEAHEELHLTTEEYPIENARVALGYEEAPLRCQQQFLRPTYKIQFFPTEAARPNRATVTVRRDARLNPTDESWTCKGWGDFPAP